MYKAQVNRRDFLGLATGAGAGALITANYPTAAAYARDGLPRVGGTTKDVNDADGLLTVDGIPRAANGKLIYKPTSENVDVFYDGEGNIVIQGTDGGFVVPNSKTDDMYNSADISLDCRTGNEYDMGFGIKISGLRLKFDDSSIDVGVKATSYDRRYEVRRNNADGSSSELASLPVENIPSQYWVNVKVNEDGKLEGSIVDPSGERAFSLDATVTKEFKIIPFVFSKGAGDILFKVGYKVESKNLVETAIYNWMDHTQ